MIPTRQKIRILLLTLILALSALVVLMVLTRERLSPQEDIAEDIAVQADAALSDFKYTQVEAGHTKWNLVAVRGTHDAKQDKTHLENIKAEFLGATAADNIVMTADEAEASLEHEAIEARGNVIVTMENGYQLKTPVLEYVGNNVEEQSEGRDLHEGLGGVIRTAAYVEFDLGAIKIQGVGMTYQVESRFLRIHSDVKAHLYPVDKNGR